MRIGIVIVNWNGLTDTEACLESLARHGAGKGHAVETLVVDNGSRDGSTEAFAKRAGIVFLPQEENLGFAAAANIGAREALARGAEAVLFLNNDARADRNFLEPLAAEIANDPAVGIAGPKVEWIHPAGAVWYEGGWTDLALGRSHHRMPDGVPRDEPCDVGFVTGCAMLVRREVLEQVGFLDEGYFMYCEDNDFCLRATAGGWRLRYVPRARVFHKVSGSGADSRTPQGAYLSARNRFLLARRFGSFRDLARFPFAYGWEMVARLARSVRHARWRVVVPTVAGIAAGLLAPRRASARYHPPGWILRRQETYRARKSGLIA